MHKATDTSGRTDTGKDRLLEAIRGHQVALEQQNEELRRARVEIEADLQKYYELYDFAPVGYCTVDPSGTVQESNLAAALLLGVDRSRLLASNLRDFVSAASRRWLTLFLEQVCSVESKATGEIKIPDNDGEERHLYLEGTSFETPSGERRCRIAMMDVTKSRQTNMELEHYRYHLEELVQQRTCELEEANNRLREQAESLHSIYQALDSIGLIVCSLDEEDVRIEIFSAGAEKLFGYSQREVLGQSLVLIYPPEDRALIGEQVRQLRQGQALQSFDMTLARRSGDQFPAVVSIHPFAQQEGLYTKAVGGFRDISELMLIQKQLQAMNNELERRVSARTAELNESNVALKVLLTKREEDKMLLSEQVLSNCAKLVDPFLDRLLQSGLNEQQQVLVEILRTNILELTAPFANTFSSKMNRLTPVEIQVANLVKLGKRTKEIAEIMHISTGTISIHRKNIRRKLDLTHQKTNLQTMLSTKG